MGSEQDTSEQATQLGKHVALPTSPEAAVLERVDNPQGGVDYAVRFTCPEFTSLCPVTGQPDFAHLVIDYVPGDWLVESKSLKLYLGAFRNHGAFHEDCTVACRPASLTASHQDAFLFLRWWVDPTHLANLVACLNFGYVRAGQARV